MFRMMILAGSLALATASVVYAQEPTPPPLPEDALAPRELIAWSNLQIPRPAQQQPPVSQTQAREPNPDFPQRAQPQAVPQPQRLQSRNTMQPPARDSRTRTP